MTGAAPQWVPTDEDVADCTSHRLRAFRGRAHGRDDDRLSRRCGSGRWTILPRSGPRCGTTSSSVTGRTRSSRTRAMPGAQWFPGVTAELRRPGHPQRAHRSARDHPRRRGRQRPSNSRGTNCSGALRRSPTRCGPIGVGVGDRVAGYLPNIPEAVIAFLATASVGAIWSACGQDYSAKAALDRLGQLEPVVLVTAEGYEFGGKNHDKREDVEALRAGLPTLKATVFASELQRQRRPSSRRCPSTSTTRCGSCTRRGQRVSPRASCTATVVSCSST